MEGEFPQRVEKPWGFEIWFALTPQYAGKILFVKKGHRLSLQYHEKKDEVLYISSGRIRMEMERDNKDMESFILDAGQCFLSNG